VQIQSERCARLEERHDRHAGRGQHDVRLKRYQLHRIGAETFGIAIAPSEIDLQISADRPTQLLQAPNKGRSATVHLGVVGTGIREHADAPHPFALLRARRERPRRRGAAEQRDELAPLHLRSHSITSSARASSVGGMVRPSVFAV